MIYSLLLKLVQSVFISQIVEKVKRYLERRRQKKEARKQSKIDNALVKTLIAAQSSTALRKPRKPKPEPPKDMGGNVAESATMMGSVEIVLKDEFGRIKSETKIDNMIVNTGLAFAVSRLINTNASITHFGVGDSNTATTSSMSGLVNQAGNRISILTQPTISGPENNILNYNIDVGPNDGNTIIREIGLFSSATGPSLICRTVVPSLTKNQGDTLNVIWKITLLPEVVPIKKINTIGSTITPDGQVFRPTSATYFNSSFQTITAAPNEERIQPFYGLQLDQANEYARWSLGSFLDPGSLIEGTMYFDFRLAGTSFKSLVAGGKTCTIVHAGPWYQFVSSADRFNYQILSINAAGNIAYKTPTTSLTQIGVIPDYAAWSSLRIMLAWTANNLTTYINGTQISSISFTGWPTMPQLCVGGAVLDDGATTMPYIGQLPGFAMWDYRMSNQMLKIMSNRGVDKLDS